ncbi:MAG TPA: BlaI/MecI/CopY family transcriptional regulator [Terriglobia bacterium]|nr:BlaI/MecI/CopY family transcriptional regulator [Terriglobia bacterium]
MANPPVTRSEFQLLQKLWELGPASVREVQQSLPEKERPAYTTVQTLIYRMEGKGVVRRVKKIGNAHIFEAAMARKTVYRRYITDLLEILGGSPAPLMLHLIETGKLTLADIRALEKELAAREKRK